MFTPIHALLGRTDDRLDGDLLQAACDQHLAETDHLDWKQGLYNRHDQNAKLEWAKDVAAMANTGGGWIVFGIAEKDGQPDLADHLSPISWLEDEAKRLRAWAAAYTSPAVFGIEFTPISVEGGDIVLVRIPAPIDRPVFAVARHGGLWVPVRYAAHTRFMGTTEIEREYRARFQREEGLRDKVERLFRECSAHDNTKLVATMVAVPHESMRTALVGKDRIGQIITGCKAYVSCDKSSNFPLTNGAAPRPGLRRWRLCDSCGEIDFHADGTLTVSNSFWTWPDTVELARSVGPRPLGTSDVGSGLLERFIDASIALATSFVRDIGAAGLYRASLRLAWETQPGFVHRPLGYGNYVYNIEAPMTSWTDIETDFDPRVDQQRYAAVWTLAKDALNQAGLDKPTVIPEPVDAEPGETDPDA